MVTRLIITLSLALLAAACSGPVQEKAKPVPPSPTSTVETEAGVEPLPENVQADSASIPEIVVDVEPEFSEEEISIDAEVPARPDVVPITIVATGDMMLGGSGTEFFERDNYDYAFKNVRDILVDADVFIGNLETALTTSDELLVEKKYRFRNPPGPVAAALARAGMDVANLANNHSLDYGYSGLDETRRALAVEGIRSIGAGANLADARQAAIIDVRGTRIAFLGYSNTFPEEFWAEKDRPGTAFGHEHQIREDIAKLKSDGVDVVVVSFHWGREGTTELREYQPLLAHAAIDSGADIVIGHHPHVLQAVERYKHGVIFYSLGNFTFGSYSRNAQDSVIARVHILDNRLQRIELMPINVLNVDVLFQPTLMEGSAAARVIAGLQSLSVNRQTHLAVDGNHAVVEWTANISSK